MDSILKKCLLLALLSGVSFLAKAQGFGPNPGMKQLNFGLGASVYGVPVYVGMDFGVSDKITIGPRISYRGYSERYGIYGKIRYSVTNISFRGDYHFGGHISGLPSELDLYGGLSAGYTIWSDNYSGPYADLIDIESSRAFLAAQAGARWYFHPNWAANAEFSGSYLAGLEVGLSYKF
ncbi:hypothetical protein JMN32_06360 [Fulvivirga sp. 29W222]|uniref:Outer membrane protein beta-barrel domain-containing protein n=1 Tax=Fulvivirga marina TaxID=2494733 RepID=A0A937KBC8_9BACT|nr:outer membrane beta-barrel protein [Fulvivirga marina]MBL6445922.1 hypothetical protein [Fulvivirga marina]